MMEQVLEALETSKKKIHNQISERYMLEYDLIDVRLQEYLEKNERKYKQQVTDLAIFRANSLVDKLKILQYDYNLQMYKFQLEEQKSVS
jgi:hypothetical protein